MNKLIPKSSAELIKKSGINEYQLVALLSSRIKELMFGAKPLIESSNVNYIETAMQEMLSNKIKPKD